MALTNCLKIVELYQTFQNFKTKPLNLKTIINLNNLVSFKVLSNKRFNSSTACDDSSEAILKNSLNEQNVSILLKLPGNKITLTTLLKAKQLSASKDMKLVKIMDSNENSKPFYKLISITDESKKNSEFKVYKKQNIKHMYISTNICDHDLKVKIKSMTGFLEKNCKVTLSINAASNPSKLVILNNYYLINVDEISNTVIKELHLLSKHKKQSGSKNISKLLFIPFIEDDTNTDTNSSNDKIDKTEGN